MPARKRTVELEVVADTKKARTALKGVGAEAETTGGRFKSAAGLMKLAMGTTAATAVVGFARDAIDSFSRLEQSVGGTEAVFGNASGIIDKFAADSAQSVGLAESEFRSATTLIGGSLKRMSGDVEFAAESAVTLTEIGADVAATYGGTTKEAVDAFAAALRGEADPAERFNFNLKVSKVNAKAVELGLARSTSEVDDAARAHATLALIVEQSADAQGQFARESDTLAGATQRANAELENAKANLGEGFAPTARDATGFAADLVTVLDGIADAAGAMTGETDASLVSLFRMTPILGDLIRVVEGAANAMEGGAEATDTISVSAEDFAANAASLEGELDALHGTTEDVGDANVAVTPTAEALAFQMERERDAAKASRDALMDKRDALREIHDPYFRVFRLSEDLTDAEKDLADAIKEHGEASDEAVAAAMRVGEINADLEGIFLDLKKRGIDPTSAAVRTMFEGLGLPQATVNRIIAQFDAMERNYEGRRFATHITVPDLHARSDGTFVKTGTRSFFHSGGIVPGVPGEDVPIVAQAGEEVIPANQRGQSGPTTVVNYYPGTTIGNERVLKELVELARRQ